MASKSGLMVVRHVTPSPVNAFRWLLTLECGHDVWVTQRSKPTKASHFCTACAKGGTP